MLLGINTNNLPNAGETCLLIQIPPECFSKTLAGNVFVNESAGLSSDVIFKTFTSPLSTITLIR